MDEIKNENFNRNRPYLISLLLLLFASGGGILYSLGFYISGTVLLLLSSSLEAILILTKAPPLCYIVCPVAVGISVAASSSLSGNIYAVIAFASFTVVGGILAYGILKKQSRSSVSVYCAAALFIFILAVLCLAWSADGNAFTSEAISAYADKQLEVIKSISNDLKNEYLSVYGQFIDPETAEGREIVAAVNELFDSLAGTFISMIPGIILVIVQICGYLCTVFFCAFTSVFKCEIIRPEPRWRLIPTIVTAVVFFIASAGYMLSNLLSFSSDGLAGVGVVVLNLWLTLMPSRFLVGVSVLFRTRNINGYKRFPAGALLIFIIFMLMFTNVAVSVVSLLGAIIVFTIRKAETKKQDGNNNTNDTNA